jgi:hypothetical protein
MTRRHPAALVAATLSLAALVAACGGTPTASPLSDPVAILEAAATNASGATSVRIDVTADGELDLDLMGTGSGAPISLADTTANLQVDIADGAVQGAFALPGVLGLRGEVVVVDDVAYLKTSLTGPLFQATPIDGGTPGGDTGTGGSPDPSAIAEMVAGLREALAQPGVDPVKGEDVPCGSSTCYTVSIQLTPEEIAALGAEAGDIPLPSNLPIPVPGLPELGDQTVDLTARVTTDTNDLAGLTLRLDDGAEGVITAEVTFSDWDAELTITAPPSDQVQGS